MTELIRQSQHLPAPLDEYFILEDIIASTRSADLYKAIDKERDQPVFLWVLRNPLPLHSEAATAFMERLKVLQTIHTISTNLLFYGLDSVGVGFAVFPPIDGTPITSGIKLSGKTAAAEPERRFTSCVRAVESLHRAGQTVGDLCHGSFWLDRDGEVQFTGVIGAFDADALSRDKLPPIETIHFVAPEQQGREIAPNADIFALGVLGYFLLTGRFPYGDEPSASGDLDPSVIVPVSAVLPNPPIWADEILRRCLSPEADARFSNASELLKGIAEARQRSLDQAGLPSKKNTEAVIKQQNKAPQVTPPAGSHGMQKGKAVGASAAPPPPAEPEATGPMALLMRLKLLVAAVVVFVISLFVASQLMSHNAPEVAVVDPKLAAHSAAAGNDPNMQQAISAMKVSEQELTEMAARFDGLIASDDPLAHVLLVKSAIDAKSVEIRNLAERALIDRVRRLGMLRSAEQLKQYLRTVSSTGTLPISYEPLLKSLNATLPQEARQGELRKAYVSDPKSALRMAASLALDAQDNSDQYQPLLAQLIGDSLGLDKATDHSALGLILAHPELGVSFGDDVVQRRTELPDKDVLWLLALLGTRNDFHVRAFASLAVERGILPPLRQYYLKVIRDQGDKVPPEVVNALVRASAGALQIDKTNGTNDIATIGQWEDVEVVPILLAICADSDKPDVLIEAFDTLAARTVSVQPSGPLIDWVRKNQWDNRVQFVPGIGVFANLEIVGLDRARQAFEAFAPHLKDERLLGILLNAKNPLITRLLLEKYAGTFDLGTLLNMLDHGDKEVRRQVIPALARYNDIGAIKIILEHFESERDEEIRQLYRDTFWFVREREQKK